MATRAVTDEQLQGIADAIKLKSGDDTPMSVADMALRIGLIESVVSKRQVVVGNEFVNGNCAGFFNAFMNIPNNHVRIILIDNTITSGNYGRFATACDIGFLYRTAARGPGANTNLQITSSYDFYIGEGSILTIYDIIIE